MDPDRGVDVRVGGGEDSSHGTTSRQTHYVHPVAVQCRPAAPAEDQLGYPRDRRRLSGPSGLVPWLEPVPAKSRIVLGALRGVNDDEARPIGVRIDLGAECRLLRRLVTAVQYDDERDGCAGTQARRRVHGVRATPGGVIVDELIPPAHLDAPRGVPRAPPG